MGTGLNKPRGKNQDHIEAGPLSDSDRAILAKYAVLAEGMARLLGTGCEVVIHSLEDKSSSVVTIFNGHVTGRAVGSPITDLALDVLARSLDAREDIVGPYFSRTEGGKPLKSVTVLLRNGLDAPIGFLCLNFDLSLSLSELVRTFSPANEVQSGAGEHFAPDVGSLVRGAVEEEREAIARIKDISHAERNRRMVLALQHRGLFDIKGAVEHAAVELGVSKFTVYKYLRTLRS